MNDLTNLIWLTHPTALNDAITAAQDGTPEDAENEFSFLFSLLLGDDTFNEYTAEELQAAIEEAVTEY